MKRLWRRWGEAVEGWSRHHRDLPRPWRLYRQALRDYRDNWRFIVWLLTIVALPVSLLSNLVDSATSNSATGAWISFAQIIMNIALIYAVTKIVAGKSITAKKAYYEGSTVLVRFLLMALLLVVLLIPVLLGTVILGAGLQTVGTALAPQERFLVILLAIVVAIPGVAMLTRGAWGVFVLFESSHGPLRALRESRKLTRGRVVVLIGRIVVLAILLSLTIVIPVAVLTVLSYATHWAIFSILLQYLVTLIVLPIATFSLYRLYRGMR